MLAPLETEIKIAMTCRKIVQLNLINKNLIRHYLHVFNNTGCFSGTIVVGSELITFKDLESWITIDRKFVASLLSRLCTIYLSESDWWRIAYKQLGCLGILWFQAFTMPAPDDKINILSLASL